MTSGLRSVYRLCVAVQHRLNNASSEGSSVSSSSSCGAMPGKYTAPFLATEPHCKFRRYRVFVKSCENSKTFFESESLLEDHSLTFHWQGPPGPPKKK